MSKSSRAVVLGVYLLLAAPLHAATPTVSSKASSTQRAHVKALKQVVENFGLAIANKDKALFLSLFKEGPVTWVSVKDSAAAAREREALPLGASQSRVSVGSHITFIDGIVRSTGAQTEHFSNVKVETDGNIAQINFDYVFGDAVKKLNWGKESWQLVNTEAGWKIVSVVWSMDWKPPAPKKEIILPVDLLSEYAGRYAVGTAGVLTIEIDGGRLAASLGSEPKTILFAESRNVFFDKVWGSTTEFVRDASGRVTHLITRENGGEGRSERLP